MKINREERARAESKDKEKLKKGFTTGSCATAATVAALEELFLYLQNDEPKMENMEDIDLKTFEKVLRAEPETDICDFVRKENIRYVNITVPKGNSIFIKAFCKNIRKHRAIFAVKKYSGDDPDVTNGTLICSKVTLLNRENFEKKKNRIENQEVNGAILLSDNIILRRGKGVGLVTKPGLACNIGEPAINPIPRKMIKSEIVKILKKYCYDGFIEVQISIPEGIQLARKTFNPNLGIIGGISILGTTGIVEPMSEQALIDTIKVEMSVRKKENENLVIITPGNYGKDFLTKDIEISENLTVKCSNFIGEALHFAGELKFKKVVLSGHLGKMIKVAGGVLNTHSKYGDRRMEIIEEFCKEFKPNEKIFPLIRECVMVDEAVRIIEEYDLKEKVMARVCTEIEKIMRREIGNNDVQVGVIVFSNKYGILVESSNISELLSAETK